LSIPKTTVYSFKRAAAAYFEAGYEKILTDLLRGKLINIDETTVNLQNEKGYVWVLASTDAVYFFFRKSREGSFLGEMLRRFKGVLVSDFFTAYDSLSLPQQRCLVHLMRDMNDDLLKYPFDDQLKSIAVRFSGFLKDVVGTIDKYGLKKRHLNKHKVPAMKLCDWVTGKEFTSPVAIGYARRFAKYRNYLFRFLGHDGIPWNNNNAEHAIKRFAKFRRTANGVTTEDTISDYLILLSVCLTCEYRSINFLNVLLGKKDRDYGFGPKRPTQLSLRESRDGRASGKCGKSVGSDTATLTETGLPTNLPSVISLNKVLPRLVGRLHSWFQRLRCRVILAPDLWPVLLPERELVDIMVAFVYVLRRETRQRPLILGAKNLRFDRPDPALGLSGRYVAVSLSDGGRIQQFKRPAPEDLVPTGLEKEISLGEACMRARALGGAASFTVTPTGQKSLTTVITTFIPQHVQNSRAVQTTSAIRPS
jgi:hypothetical protein